MSIEQIVRPFALPAAFDARSPQPVTAPAGGPEVIEIIIKGSVDTELTTDPEPNFLGVNVEDYETESVVRVKRRIENPDDPSQYVIVQDVTEYNIRNKIDGSRIKIRPFED